MKRVLILILLLLLIQLINAQHPERFINPSLMTPSLIDFSKLSINHTVSFSSGFSSDNKNYYQSMYTNHLQYTFSPKLKLSVDLNFTNFGTATYKGGLKFDGNRDNSSQVFPEFSLQYQPSENTSIIFEYRRINPYSINNYYRNW